MTFKEIIDQEPAKVSRFTALTSIHELGAEARRKADTLRESRGPKDSNDELIIRWFDEIAEMAERKLELVNDSSAPGAVYSLNN